MKTDFSIKRICFTNYRNYSRLELCDLGRLVIIVGDNAVGKTNIIEGLQLVSMLDSFRKPAWNDVILQEKDRLHEYAQVFVEYHRNNCDNCIELEVRDNKRLYRFNEKAKRTRDLFGQLPSVLFTPNDLQIVKGAADQRRQCIDGLGCQLSQTFVDIKQDYTRAIKQKNALLREPSIDTRILASWNRNLVQLGSSLMAHRISLFCKLLKKAQEVYRHIVPSEELRAVYVPSWILLDNNMLEALNRQEVAEEPGFIYNNEAAINITALKQQLNTTLSHTLDEHSELEQRRGRSCIGPHRDEILFFINGANARRFGSQGQQRSIALALKIAEVEVLREITGTDPLLLLDDVMSEIDEKRRTLLLDLINTTTQTFITTTTLHYFDERTLGRAHIIRLPIKESDVHGT